MISIQKATVKDIPQIQRIAKITWPIAFKDILSSKQLEYMMELMYNTDTLHSQIAGNEIIFWLAKLNDATSGFMAFEPNLQLKDRIKIHKLYINPTAQSKGIGQILLKKLEEYGRSSTFKLLTLNVNKYNHPAIKFYTKQGFNKVEDIIIPIGKGYIMDDYVFSKKIQ
ncbi:GNAT family N-acetyltransferase [Cyclobacterium sp. 1_MG-2023]|uniref:GNAT family N-acetyltransferase n=1 Tax=Cyclobacterium sp. 1_MG-2023 TaxID=3062681 RepID=UPI0026E44A8A|nr:GNAT family N-acetyltransferase [Cyclobacterium sp. 1_MG-2023]MDO6436583.1 GNAT family N-acetyltransferase [Cyclobacterium sp. 1_MG-2023]